MSNIFNDILLAMTEGQARIAIKDTIYDMLLTNIENGYTRSGADYTRYRTQKVNRRTSK